MRHPYETLPDERRWSRAVADRPNAEIDPAVDVRARIRPGERVVTAGSCFAQHVSRHLEMRGRPCLRTETGHPLLGAELSREFGYGIYAARYGNLYTTRQLLQLWLRATGELVPRETHWEQDGAFHDPFRPIVQPGGFPTLEELDADRRRHFAAVREAFTTMDVMIFTMGLTECWTSAEDGAVYPLCPGVACGEFDPARHVMVNLTAEEVAADMEELVERVRAVNPAARFIVTVSPQPQTATAEDRHVLVEAGYSKAKLRVAAERICRMPDVDYFPAFEIVTVPGTGYFGDDRRSVREEGIARVMEVFFEHVVEGGPVEARETTDAADSFLEHGERLLRAVCDEDLLDGKGDSIERPPKPPAPKAPPRSPVSDFDQRKMRARALAIEGKLEEALALAEALQREEARPGLGALVERWRARLSAAE